MINRFRPAPLAVAVAVASALGVAGCGPLGYVGEIITGPDRVKALYQPINQETVVLVDDPTHQLTTAPLAGVIASGIASDLTRQKVITSFIDASKIDELRAQHKDFDQWPVDRVGQAVGARQVIYVLVSQFSLAADEVQQAYKPGATVRVKVLDATTGKRLFPTNDQLGQPVASAIFMKQVEATRTTESVISRELAQRVAEDVAFLFYDHEVRNEIAPTRQYQ